MSKRRRVSVLCGACFLRFLFRLCDGGHQAAEEDGCGATVPLSGFGYLLSEGVKAAVKEKGILGVFTGGITAGAAGIAAAVFFSCLMAAIAKPKEKT